MQDRSAGPLEEPESFEHHARLLDAAIRRQKARTIFYLTWANRHRPETQAVLTKAYERMAEELGAHFFQKGVRETDPRLAAKNPELRAKLFKMPCTDVYLQLGIYWNGDVVPCAYANNGNEIFGNVARDSLETIWQTAAYREFRRRVTAATQDPERAPELCAGCLRWNATGEAPNLEDRTAGDV